jgi:glycine/D-amino acid oxidase-like deaminating enzyme
MRLKSQVDKLTSKRAERVLLYPLLDMSRMVTNNLRIKQENKKPEEEKEPARPVSKYSKSVNEFFKDINENAKSDHFATNDGFNYWTTPNLKLMDIAKKNFGEQFNEFAIGASSIATISTGKSKVHVKSDHYLKERERNFRKEKPSIFVASGGISALFATYLMSDLYKNEQLPKGTNPPIYIKPFDIKNSATKGSSGQYHVSHAAPMYTDPEFSALNILSKSIRRRLFGEDPEKDNYMIGQIDLKSLWQNPDVMRVGLGYLGNELYYKVRNALGYSTILDETIPLAIESGKIMDKIGEIIGNPILLRKNTIRIAYNSAETLEMEESAKKLQQYDIVCRRISSNEEIFEKTGTTPKIGNGGSIWEVEGDGNMDPGMFDALCNAITKNGGEVLDGTVSTILCDAPSKQVTGVVLNLGLEEGQPKSRVIRADNVYTSCGHNAEYLFHNGIKPHNKIEKIIPATGYSAYLLVEGNIKCPIDSNNTHFTPMSTANIDGNDVTLVKTTCGGAIGTADFNTDHARNSLHYATHIVFPGKKVEILSTKACSRPINSKNSGVITEAEKNFWVGTGFGGKGITDGAAFAAQVVERSIQKDNHTLESFRERFNITNRDSATGRE